MIMEQQQGHFTCFLLGDTPQTVQGKSYNLMHFTLFLCIMVTKIDFQEDKFRGGKS